MGIQNERRITSLGIKFDRDVVFNVSAGASPKKGLKFKYKFLKMKVWRQH